MNKRKILASLNQIANNLDLIGRSEEADKITGVMVRISNVFDDDFNDMAERNMDDDMSDEMSDYSFSGEDDDFEDDENDFPTDDDMISEFDMERTPGRSEMFENDMPGEIPTPNPLKFMKAVREDLEARMPDATEEEIDDMVDEMMEKFNSMVNRDIDF